MAVFEFIEGGYNTRPRHSSLGCQGPSPDDYERSHALREFPIARRCPRKRGNSSEGPNRV
jgi:hypothetical protein